MIFDLHMWPLTSSTNDGFHGAYHDICDAIWENLPHGENLTFWIFSTILKDFNLHFVSMIPTSKVTYFQS